MMGWAGPWVRDRSWSMLTVVAKGWQGNEGIEAAGDGVSCWLLV